MGDSTPHTAENCIDLTRNLVVWFRCSARDLPWRHDRTPYRVWLAEVMLQQTRTETAIPYYARFLERFPSIESLAKASLEEVLKVWEGLGYYARARHLHAAARQVVREHGGRLPETFEELIALPGVGSYTAGAVASIAFGAPVVALDGNASRVLSRRFAVAGDPRRAVTRKRLETLAQACLLAECPGVFNEALIELGATVCHPRNPECGRCPLANACRAHAQGREEAFPQRAPRRPVPHYDVTAAVLTRDGTVLVTQRERDDFLGGLWEFPGGRQEDGETLAQCLRRELQEELGIEVAIGEPLLRFGHAYTHFRITLHVFRCELLRGVPQCLECAAVRWARPEELDALPMSVADRRIADLVQLE
ncbi:MAG: A/G-specific adenine glycosylase [Anaerolineae bacterium]|jgi:A/G-specific adenine glycosylase